MNMNIPNIAQFAELHEKLSEHTKLRISEIPEDTTELIQTLNTLAVLSPEVRLASLIVVDDCYIIDIVHEKKVVSSVYITTANELITTATIAAIEITSDLTTASNTLNGMVYSPYAKMPMYYSKDTEVLLKPNTEVVEHSKMHDYLGDVINLYEKNLKTFLPMVHLIEARRAADISASQTARGFTRAPKIGDPVEIMPYDMMIAMYGENTESAAVPYARAQSKTYGRYYLKPLSHLAGKRATITSISTSTGIVTLECIEDDKNIFDIDSIEIDGITHDLDITVVYHEQMLMKV